MTRLWTTAEQSAMLENPNVSTATFIEVETWNHITMAFAASAILAVTNLTLSSFLTIAEVFLTNYHFLFS